MWLFFVAGGDFSISGGDFSFFGGDFLVVGGAASGRKWWSGGGSGRKL